MASESSAGPSRTSLAFVGSLDDIEHERGEGELRYLAAPLAGSWASCTSV